MEVKLFGKWSYEGIALGDVSLEDFIAVKAKDAVFLPHTAGRYQVKRFRKALCPIVERLCNALMRKGRNNGKKLLAVRIVQQAFEIIHLATDENPLQVRTNAAAAADAPTTATPASPFCAVAQVFVRAVVNSGPREDSTRVGAGGIVRRQAVDVSPFRRVNQAVYLMGIGAREASFRTIKTIAECLADEVINASKGSSNSYAIKKKDEIERVAKANR
jgi:small subunit ribosomal protein S5e